MPNYKINHICISCGNSYLSSSTRDGLCPDCSKTRRGQRHTAYRNEHYDSMVIYVPKGDKEKIKEFVSEHNTRIKSVNDFFNTAIAKYKEEIIKKDNDEMEEIAKLFSYMEDAEKKKWSPEAAIEMYTDNEKYWKEIKKAENPISTADFLYDTIKAMIETDEE